MKSIDFLADIFFVVGSRRLEKKLGLKFLPLNWR